jgi:hypothetical protein
LTDRRATIRLVSPVCQQNFPGELRFRSYYGHSVEVNDKILDVPKVWQNERLQQQKQEAHGPHRSRE